MTTMLPLTILGIVDHDQPMWVQCKLVDAYGKTHLIVDKLPIFAEENLKSEERLPASGFVRCEVLREWTDPEKGELALIDLSRPDGVESTENVTEFVVHKHEVIHL